MAAPVLDIDLRLAWPGFTLAVQHRQSLQGITAVFGPSGCGKSTLLRAIAGLEPAATGRLALDDAIWIDSDGRRPVPAHARGVGLVFQDARLFGHLSVDGNLRYAAQRARHVAAPAIHHADVVRALDLAPLLTRRAGTLSGGERQRVAIARTLLSRPRLLLMDEPLAALDARRKAEILPLIEALPATFGVPVLYVSHDLDEVGRLAQQIVLLAAGRVVGAGPLSAVLENLERQPALDAFEAGVMLETRVRRQLPQWQLTELDLAGQTLVVPTPEGVAAAPGSLQRLRIRARDVALAREQPQGLSIRNVLAGTLLQLREEPGSAHAETLVGLPGGARLRARITRQAVAELGLAEGQPVYALVKSIALAGAGGGDAWPPADSAADAPALPD
jgi:molybdate transport system ATP-binding protein